MLKTDTPASGWNPDETLAAPREGGQQTVKLRIGEILARKEIPFTAAVSLKSRHDTPGDIARRDEILAPNWAVNPTSRS